MFVFDVETLGKESNSVILSMAAIYFNPDEQPEHTKLFDEAFFVKFDVADQMSRLDRKVGKSTMQWWAKQCENVRVKSFKPNPAIDVKFEDGYEAMRQWAATKNDNKCYVWARGNLDQLVLDSFEEQLGLTPIWDFARWRDVRTAVDFLYGTTKGYVKVDTPPWMEIFDKDLHITKHNPIDDCVLDAMMLMYGVPEGKTDEENS
jgi:hypothetical protein